MSLRESIEKLINIQEPGFIINLALLPLNLCAYLYRFIVSVRTFLYKQNILANHNIPCKVITIGNITVGGTGKTPTVCFLARFLQRKGFRVAVLNRGYLGSRTQSPQVVSDGNKVLASAEAVGDEALMLAKKLSFIPVLAASDRVAAGEMAVNLFRSDIIILDDGFQYLRMKRDLDIVLVNAIKPFGNGFLLPRGALREPLSALSRASLILLTKTDKLLCDTNELKKRIRMFNPNAFIFKSFFKPISLIKAKEGTEISLDYLEGRKVLGFCGIGDPDSFFIMLNDLKVRSLQKLVFPDHHAYSGKDYRQIDECAEKSDCLITTEKDIAKIDIDMLHSQNLMVLKMEIEVEDEELFISTVMKHAGIV